MLALAAALALTPTTRTVILERGAALPDGLCYWRAEDTFLDSKAPDVNYGRDRLLTAGPGRTVLIRFADVARAIGSRTRVEQARLILRIEIGSAPTLKSVRLLNGFWNEGPGRRGALLGPEPKADEKAPLPEGAPTWRHRISGKGAVAWDRAGAQGAGDGTAVGGVALSVEDGNAVITGLAEAVQAMKDRPWAATGLALEFGTSVDFASSDAPEGRPRLEIVAMDAPVSPTHDLAVTRIEWDHTGVGFPAPGTEVGWTAVVENVGSQPAHAFSGRWIGRAGAVGGPVAGGSLAPGQEARFSIRVPFRGDPARPSASPLAFAIEGSDANPANDALLTWESARPVDSMTSGEWSFRGNPRAAAQQVMEVWNQTVLAHSRFSFAPEGAMARYRIQAWSEGAALGSEGDSLREELAGWAQRLVPYPSEDRAPITLPGGGARRRTADPYPGLRGWGDTRDEADLIPQVPLLYEPWPDDAAIEALGMRPTDLLSATDVAALNAGEAGPGVGKTVIVTLFDGAGRPAREQALELYVLDQGEPKGPATIKTSKTGNFVVPAEIGGVRPLGDPKQPKTVVVRARQGSVDEVAFIAGWQFTDAYARLGQPASFLNLRMALAAGNVDSSQDLALNKIVTDGRGSLPAALAAIVDGNPETASAVPAGAGWIEIDLGRDRPVGEITLEVEGGKVWPRFRILAYATGQRAAEAREWVRETAGDWMLAQRGNGRAIAYRGTGVRARFFRIELPDGAPAIRLAAVRAHPLTSE